MTSLKSWADQGLCSRTRLEIRAESQNQFWPRTPFSLIPSRISLQSPLSTQFVVNLGRQFVIPNRREAKRLDCVETKYTYAIAIATEQMSFPKEFFLQANFHSPAGMPDCIKPANVQKARAFSRNFQPR